MDPFVKQCYKSVISALETRIQYAFPKNLLVGEGKIHKYPWYISEAGDVIITESNSDYEDGRRIKIEIGRDPGKLLSLLSKFISRFLDDGVALENFRDNLQGIIGQNIGNRSLEDLTIKCDLNRRSLSFIIDA